MKSMITAGLSTPSRGSEMTKSRLDRTRVFMCGGHVGQYKHAARQNMQIHANDKVQVERSEVMLIAGCSDVVRRQNDQAIVYVGASAPQLAWKAGC